jgi:hypothetical protein
MNIAKSKLNGTILTIAFLHFMLPILHHLP